MKSTISFFILLSLAVSTSVAQEISFDGTVILKYMDEPRFTDIGFSDYGVVGQVGLSYNDTLSKKLDFKVGLSYMGGSEGYNRNGVAYLVGELGDSLQISTSVYDRYQASWISLNLGGSILVYCS